MARLTGVGTGSPASMEDFVRDTRFSGGLVCPVCGCVHVIRHGHGKDGKQRYLCRGCGKTFAAMSNSIVSETQKDISVWEKYIDCMMHGFSVRKSAAICGIHRNTAFAWRHKILDALQNMAGSVVMAGIVEADEMFLPLSYKGNHRKGSFRMPRAPHKRGGAAALRGISKEKVCVPCAVNRDGFSIAKASNLGRVAAKDLQAVYGGRIEPGTTMVTDIMNSYRRFANGNGLTLVQVKGGRTKKGIYNIQHINSYHGRLKKFLRAFNGVSTKHLDNYLVWHNFVNYAPESDADKHMILLRFALTQPMTVRCRDIPKRPPLPFAA